MASSLPAVPATITAGTKPTAASFNTYRDNLNFLLNPPRCHAYLAAAQSPANNGALVALDTLEINTDSFTLSTNAIVIQTPGRYRCLGQVAWAANATGRRGSYLRKNGGNVVFSQMETVTDGGTPFLQVTDDILFAAADTVSLFANQVSGAGLALTTGSTNTFLHIVWVGES